MKLRLLSSASAPLALLLALLPLAGCPASLEDGEEDVGETSTGETDTGESSSGESESAGEQGESSSETAGESSTGETGSESTTSDPGESSTDETGSESTTGEPDPGIEEACTGVCEVFAACFEPIPNCVQECIAEFSQSEGECLDAQLGMASCLDGLSCEALQQYMEGSPEPYPCQAEEEALELSCDGAVCQAGVGMGENPGECSFEYICPNDPIYEVVCDGASCSCIEDGVEVGACSEAAAFCNADDFNAAAGDCCGWEI